MPKVLTENQSLLARYLFAIGFNLGMVSRVLTDTWDEDATIDMLEFCHDNPDASQAQLLEMSSKISSKYNEM